MFDVEYGEYLDHSERKSDSRVVVLSSRVLQRLAADAVTGAESVVRKWHEAKEAEIASALMHDKSSFLLRFLTRVFGQTIPENEEHARVIAKKEIKRYPSFMGPWKAEDALANATRWLSASKKLTYLKSFDVPIKDFEELRDWASKS